MGAALPYRPARGRRESSSRLAAPLRWRPRSSGPFRSAKAATGVTPERVTTDGDGSYPRAIRTVLGRRVVHRTSAYKNNGLEQDHRGVKGRTRCMRGFKSFASAERFCRGYDELRDFLRPRTRHNQPVPAHRRRLLHLRRATAALVILEAA